MIALIARVLLAVLVATASAFASSDQSDPPPCAPDRFLIAGSPASTTDDTGLYWLADDLQTPPTPIELHPIQRSFLVALSPDKRWVAYYQRSPQATTDRFVVDTWVLDVTTDQRIRLVEGNAPLGWISNSHAVVLGERPNLMVTVPEGTLVPTDGQLLMPEGMRAATSPDGAHRAVVATAPSGADGINIFDLTTSELVMAIPTGRGAVQLAWSADSTRLAFTSATDSPDGLLWKLRQANLAQQSVTLVPASADMAIHSVVSVPGCA